MDFNFLLETARSFSVLDPQKRGEKRKDTLFRRGVLLPCWRSVNELNQVLQCPFSHFLTPFLIGRFGSPNPGKRENKIECQLSLSSQIWTWNKGPLKGKPFVTPSLRAYRPRAYPAPGPGRGNVRRRRSWPLRPRRRRPRRGDPWDGRPVEWVSPLFLVEGRLSFSLFYGWELLLSPLFFWGGG